MGLRVRKGTGDGEADLLPDVESPHQSIPIDETSQQSQVRPSYRWRWRGISYLPGDGNGFDDGDGDGDLGMAMVIMFCYREVELAGVAFVA